MKSNLHENELRFITMFKSSQQKLQYFYLFWSLKEAYLKAIGIGIGHPDYPLCSLDFSCFEKHNQCTIHHGYWNNKLLDEVFMTLMLQPTIILAVATSSDLCNSTRKTLSISKIVWNDQMVYFSKEGNCSICIIKENCDKFCF